MIRHTLAALAISLPGVLLLTAGTADARQVENGAGRGAHRLAYVERYHNDAGRVRFWVETRDGAAYVLRRCRTEDDARPCFWDARKRGNGLGWSFARVNRDGDLARFPRPVR